MTNEPITIEMIEQETGIEKTGAQKILEHFQGFLEEAGKLEAEAKKINITNASQVDDMKKAREIRLQLRTVRTNAEKVKTKLKERVLIEGNFIQGIYNAVLRATKPLEEDLEAQEKFVQLQEESRLMKLTEARNEALRPFVPDISVYSLRDMSEESFEQLLTNAKEAHALKIKAEEEAQKAKEKKDKQDAEEREKLRIENEKLKKEADEKDRLRQLEIDEQKRKDEETERKLKQLQLEKIEAEKIANKAIEDSVIFAGTQPISPRLGGTTEKENVLPWEASQADLETPSTYHTINQIQNIPPAETHAVKVQALLGDDLILSMRAVIRYLYRDEERNWFENGKPKKDHIFNDVSKVAEWLEAINPINHGETKSKVV